MSLLRRLPRGFARALSRLPGRQDAELRWWLAQDPRRVCRRLHLESWELWDTVDGVACFEPAGDTALAVWTVLQYRGPVELNGRLWQITGTNGRALTASSGPEARLRVHGHIEKDGSLRVRVETI